MVLDEVRKYYDLIKSTELRALYDDDFQFELIENELDFERHISDLDESEKLKVRNAVENELRESKGIVFYSSESAGDVYSSLEDFLVYLLNEILYQKLLVNTERGKLSSNFMELEISIKKLLILIWTK